VFNRQYSAEQYETLVSKIIKHMQISAEWGEFFPTSISSLAYNETVAQEYFPLTKEEVCNNSWSWKDVPDTRGAETIAWRDLPGQINSIPETICDHILACTACQRNYRLTRPELKLYKKLGVAIPNMCFDCRYQTRRNMRNPRK
jgi:hypothetical protein